MNRFFIRFIGAAIAGATGFFNSASAWECTYGAQKAGNTAYYKQQTCPTREVYQTNMNMGKFPGMNDTGNIYAYQEHQVVYEDISIPMNGKCAIHTGTPIGNGMYIVPCNENKVSFSEASKGGGETYMTKTCSEPSPFDAGSGNGCIVDESGLVTAPSDDFFKAYDGCFCASGLTCYESESDSGSGSDSGADTCKFYYYKTTWGASSAYVFGGCKPGYYQNRELASGEVFAFPSHIDALCSPCSGMKYTNGTVSTYVPANGETGADGIIWKSNGGIGIESCYANGEIQDDAGIFTFESNCKYSE